MRLLALFLAASMTVGCATVTWVKPGGDFGVDSGQCQAQALSAGAGAAPRQLIYEACMQGKGWEKQRS